MESPFLNDPCAIVAAAFRRVSDKEYIAQVAPSEQDGVYGETVFPEDGSVPIIFVYANTLLEHMPEVFAHELAHLAAGADHGHDGTWEYWFNKIGDTYEALTDELIAKHVADNI